MLCLPSVLLLAKQLEHSVHPTDTAVTERWRGCPERVAPSVGAAGYCIPPPKKCPSL
ncbi:unnamed protein product [Ectocarpus sp. 12 AP-2014]